MNIKIFKTIVSIICVTILGFVAVQKIYAADNFYVQLDINEVASGSKVKFSLKDAAPLYGDYDSFFNVYNKDTSTGNYILETYNSSKQEIAEYALSSSRITYYDTETGGGETVNDSGVIKVIIPYDANNIASFVKINNQGIKTDFIAIPTAQIAQDISKIPLCKKENETVDISVNNCCSDLIPVAQSDNSYICVNCGDEKCSQYESPNSCPLDCKMASSASSEATVKNAVVKNTKSNSLSSNSLLYFGMIILVILLVSIIVLIVVIRKKKKEKDLSNQNQSQPLNRL